MSDERLWQLRPASGQEGPTLRFGPGVHVLGSSDSSDLRVSHRTVSRRHVRFTCLDGRVTVEDLGSTNGTVIDGEVVTGPVEVTRAVTVKIGDVVLVLEPLEPAGTSARGADPSSGHSMLLGPATVGFLRGAGREMAFGPGDVIMRRGERHDVFFVVTAGEVELLLQEGDSRQRPLARLSAGGIFGAESALSKDGAAVDAVAVGDVRVLGYPSSGLAEALKESESLRRKLLGGFARHLHEATADALDLLRSTEVIARLVQGDSDPAEMVAVSARMQGVVKSITKCAEDSAPVLVAGEDGTGKTLVARLLHDTSQRSGGPLIAVNCRELAKDHAAELILGDDLGGLLPKSGHSSGGVHLAHGGTLVLRGADTLERSVQQLLASHLSMRQRVPAGAYPDTRVILTCRACGTTCDERGGLDPNLLAAVEARIEIPPLVKRPKDIMPLAEQFLRRYGPQPPVVTDGARHALLSLTYQRRNVAELREVLDLAVRLADGGEIRAEHIFGGVGDDAVLPGLDVTSSPLVRRLLQRLGAPALRAVTLVGFLGVIVVCLGFAGTLAGRLANGAIWSLWEPAVFGLFLLAGPVWCTICPLSTGARLAKRIGARDRPPPVWLIRHGPWLAVIGFALIIWVEKVFHSLANPVASGLLLTGLISASVLLAVLFQREVWCRHLCPLGRFATVLAPAAPLQLRAHQSVCASSCSTHDCYKGADRIPGCTVFHHPLDGKQAYRCKLCLDCLRSCPHGSARLEVRPPLAAVWRLDQHASDLAMFALSVSLLALALLVPPVWPWLAEPVPFTLLCGTALAVGIGFHHLLQRIAGGDTGSTTVARTSVVTMLVGWAALMVSQLANIPPLVTARLVIEPPTWLSLSLPAEIGLLPLLQLGFLLFGLALASIAVTHLRSSDEAALSRAARFAVWVVLAAYTGVAAWLVVASTLGGG